VTLGSDGHSEDFVQDWVVRFQSGGTICGDLSRPAKPFTDLAGPFYLFLQVCPLADARILSRHFNVCPATVRKVLARDLGLQKFTRQWVPHTLSEPQKIKRVEASIDLIQILNGLEADSFDGITTGRDPRFDMHMSPRLCLRSRQATSSQEREKELV
jgi:hypothetical protein